MESGPERVRVTDFYTETVLPALAERLDGAFPEFGWRRDARGWVATNEEYTHTRLGVRAQRVVAHGPAPRGFLVHGGEPMLWTAYVSGGGVPRGQEFVRAVEEIAQRAGVDPAPIEQAAPRDQRADLLQNFFVLCRRELVSERGAEARAYLERRGFPGEAIEDSGIGLVPPAGRTRDSLERAGYGKVEIAAAGILADSRWPGRLCGAWRDERGRIRTLWSRSLGGPDSSTRYLYLRGASRSGLPPYGLSDVLRSPPSERRELVLVEGLVDVHHLQSKGLPNVAAAGGARLQAGPMARLGRLGFDSVVLAFDNDVPGREGLARAVEVVSRAREAPTLRVLEPRLLGDSKDPDAFVREHGLDRFRALVDQAGCAITWRALELADGVTPQDNTPLRRAALARVGNWLGSLPARLALEQEDAVRHVADQCGYSRAAVERAFRARFWNRSEGRGQVRLSIER